MAGLKAIKGIFGAVLLCSLLALVFILTGLLVHDWGTTNYKNKTDVNKAIRRQTVLGLWGSSSTGKCMESECEDAFPDALEDATEKNCKKILQLVTQNSDDGECKYLKKGYCRCPHAKDDYARKQLEKFDSLPGSPFAATCKAIEDSHGGTCAENGSDYGKSTQSALEGAVICLIIACVLIFLCIAFAVIGMVTSKWIMGPGILGAIFLFLALIVSIIGLIMGTQYIKQTAYQGSCGSIKHWNEQNDKLNEHAIRSVNCFATGPILVTIGIVFLFIAVILDCMVTGLGKKISKVADIS